MKTICILILLLFFSANFSYAQIDRSVPISDYAAVLDSLTLSKLIENGVVNKNNNIAKIYRDKKNPRKFSNKGFSVYFDIRAQVFINYFKDYAFLQSVHYNDAVYVLYFAFIDVDDLAFQVLKWNQNDWNDSDKIDRALVDQPNEKFEKIAFNYDKGPKNLKNVRIFIKNDYLVMERSGLYYSLYDLKTNQLIVNEENPWKMAADNSSEAIDNWVRENLHIKIEARLEINRE